LNLLQARLGTTSIVPVIRDGYILLCAGTGPHYICYVIVQNRYKRNNGIVMAIASPDICI